MKLIFFNLLVTFLYIIFFDLSRNSYLLLLLYVLLSILIGMLIMCIILIAETIIEPKTRLTWPYGDLVPGGYIAKFSVR